MAAGRHPNEISHAWLVQDKAGVVDHAPTTEAFLKAVAPDAKLEITTWA